MASLRRLASAGRLERDDMVFKTGTADWVKASTVAGLFSDERSAPALPPEGELAFSEEKTPARRKARRSAERTDEDEPPARSKKAASADNVLVDVLMFRRMHTPLIIVIAFWVGVAVVILYGLMALFFGLTVGSVVTALGGLLSIPIGILFGRLYCEMMFVMLRMNDTLTEIKNSLERRQDQ